MARIHRCQGAEVPISTVLNLGAFDLDQVLARRPTFLEPEYPFEWTGVYSLPAGRFELSLDEGPDPTMSLVVAEDLAADDEALRRGAEWCVRRYAEPAAPVEPGGALPLGRHLQLQLQPPGRKSFVLELEKPTSVALFAQHTAEEFDLLLRSAPRGDSAPQSSVRTAAPTAGAVVEPVAQRTWVAQHEHDDEVGSVAIEMDGDVNPEALNRWLSTLLRERGIDIFRMKGFISIAGEARRFVFQGVHMLFNGQPERPWGDAVRRSQLVFIGRNLDEKAMRRGFEACLSAPASSSPSDEVWLRAP